MILRIFRTHANIQLIAFFIIALLLWADGFYHLLPGIPASDISPLYALFFNWCAEFPLPSTLLAFLLLVAEALLLNNILSAYGICSKNNYLPAFVYMVLYSYCPQLLRMHAVIPANFFLILALYMIWNAQQKERSYQDLFTAALFVSVSALFDCCYLVFFPIVWIALILFRTISWREWLIVLLGLMTPVLYVAFLLFWFDQLEDSAMNYLEFFRNIRILRADYRQDFMIYIISGMILLLTFPAFIRFLGSITEKVINIRRVSATVTWLFILSILIMMSARNEPWLQGSAVLLPASVIISVWLQSGKKTFWREVLLLLLLAGIITGKFLL